MGNKKGNRWGQQLKACDNCGHKVRRWAGRYYHARTCVDYNNKNKLVNKMFICCWCGCTEPE